MAKKDLQIVAETVAWMTENGITPVEHPNWVRAYEGFQGSIANFRKVTLGEIKPVNNPPLGEPELAVYVDYTAQSESGEDLCDFTIHETRYVRLVDLKNYLQNKGW